jgi:uncharacterized protein (TIGR02453 family)
VAFRGWTTDALDFFEGLEADNSKTYWMAHKAVYDEKVYAPMAALVAELEPELGAGKIFRPYRDLRFSADKSPYKTDIACKFDKGGFVHLAAAGLGAGRGMWTMAPDQLARYRRAVHAAPTGERLRRVIATLARAGIEAHGHDRLKRVPRGYPADHPRAELLTYKGLIAWKQWPIAPWLGQAAAKDHVVRLLRAARPLEEWLEENVG